MRPQALYRRCPVTRDRQPTDPAAHPLAAALFDASTSADLAATALSRLQSDLIRLRAAFRAFGEPAKLAEAPARPGPPPDRS